MGDLKRDPVKWVRDKAKALYKKGHECRVCGATSNLQFHHTKSLSPLFKAWCKKRGYPINTDEDVLAIRDEFIAEHEYELYESTITLCKAHHERLHQVYGKAPGLGTSSKQVSWVEKQRIKYGLD
jgi:hypothetical protein